MGPVCRMASALITPTEAGDFMSCVCSRLPVMVTVVSTEGSVTACASAV